MTQPTLWRRLLVAAGLAALLASGAAGPAFAADHHDRGHPPGWDRGHGRDRVIYDRRFRRPPPPPVVVAPPPRYYAPPPVIAVPPPGGLNIVVPLNIR